MPSPADQRLLELLEKWLASLTLHLKYSTLDDEAYWKIQPWVKHQRPTKWILELARQKANTLLAEVRKRIDSNDQTFSDSMELMTFLANLVGSQHIERFIPLADPATERWVPEATQRMAEPSNVLPLTHPAVTGTREMPQFLAPAARERETESNRHVSRPERHAPAEPAEPAESSSENPAADTPRSAGAKRSAAKPGQRQPSKPSSQSGRRLPLISEEALEQVIADAVRLSQWGRKWYELAELISRMADRPSLPDVRRVLNDYKAEIDQKLGR